MCWWGIVCGRWGRGRFVVVGGLFLLMLRCGLCLSAHSLVVDWWLLRRSLCDLGLRRSHAACAISFTRRNSFAGPLWTMSRRGVPVRRSCTTSLANRRSARRVLLPGLNSSTAVDNNFIVIRDASFVSNRQAGPNKELRGTLTAEVAQPASFPHQGPKPTQSTQKDILRSLMPSAA